jgi:LDH2 family malate/lactate/ureidoglycolate dehydrogenase
MSGKPTCSSEKNKKRDPDLINAEIALKRAAKRARKQAKQAGIGVIVLRNGQIVEELPDKEL